MALDLSKQAQRRRVRFRKFQQWLWFGRRRCRVAFKGSVSSAQNVSSLVFGAVVTALLDWFGIEIVFAKGKLGDAAIFAVSVILAWVLVYALRVLWFVPRQIRSQGEWLGTEFIFKEPKLALLTHWRPDDNGKLREFKVAEVPPYSSIRYRIVIDGREDRTWAVLNFSPFSVIDLSQMRVGQNGTHWVILSGSRSWLEAYSLPMTDMAIIRVYILGYTKQDPHPL